MIRIVVYNGSWSTFGGGEKYSCALAGALTALEGATVSLLVDVPDITRERLEQYFNLDLRSVEVTRISPREISARLAEADLGVIISNFRPYGLRARRNVYVLQIPYPLINLVTIGKKLVRGELREGLKDVSRKLLLRVARNADLTLVYSEFVRDVLARHHSVHAQVLYPPIDDFGGTGPKRNVILSVGRFFTGPYNDKRYDATIDAFKELYNRCDDKSWEYRIVGSCADDEFSRRYVARLREAAAGVPVTFCVNIPYPDLRREYQHAAIFWHAAGFGLDETSVPDRMEHFGMSTVEAMSAGCIPVVINAGGQKEIITHGTSGYLWNTRTQLLDTTLGVIGNPAAAAVMRHEARKRYEEFAGPRFARLARELMHKQGIISDGAS